MPQARSGNYKEIVADLDGPKIHQHGRGNRIHKGVNLPIRQTSAHVASKKIRGFIGFAQIQGDTNALADEAISLIDTLANLYLPLLKERA